jgi:Uma2 family endonuclease
MGIQVKRWTRDEYDRLVSTGVLEGRHVQLVEGEILEMTPQGPGHATAIQLAGDALHAAFAPGFGVRMQLPLALGTDSEPEPDVAIVRGAPRDYRDHHPRTAELVVEVSDSTLDFDRGRKSRVYAAAGIPEYWLIDLGARLLEVFREPTEAGGLVVYARQTQMAPHESIAPLARPDVRIKVSDLLP